MNEDPKLKKYQKYASYGLSPLMAPQVREDAADAYNDNIDRACDGRPVTEEDRQRALDDLGSPWKFGASYLSERHWTLNPTFAFFYDKYAKLLGFPLAVLSFLFVYQLIAEPNNNHLTFLLYNLWSNIAIFYGLLMAITASLLPFGSSKSIDPLKSEFSAREFVLRNNGVTLRGKGILYLCSKALFVLGPLALPICHKVMPPHWAAVAALLLVSMLATEHTVRGIHQRRKATYLTRIAVDMLLTVVICIYWRMLEIAAPDYLACTPAYFQYALPVYPLLLFFGFILFDIIHSLIQITKCHRHSLRTVHPAIDLYVKAAPEHLVEAVKEQIQEHLMECGADHLYPRDEELISVLEKLGDPDGVISSFMSRGLLPVELATLSIVYHNKLILLSASELLPRLPGGPVRWRSTPSGKTSARFSSTGSP